MEIEKDYTLAHAHQELMKTMHPLLAHHVIPKSVQNVKEDGKIVQNVLKTVPNIQNVNVLTADMKPLNKIVNFVQFLVILVKEQLITVPLVSMLNTELTTKIVIVWKVTMMKT